MPSRPLLFGRHRVRQYRRTAELQESSSCFPRVLYTSPNKAIEELVANSFDAGARQVHVLLSANLHRQDATITVVDDGEGMGAEDLERHWLIGVEQQTVAAFVAKAAGSRSANSESGNLPPTFSRTG